MQICYVFCSSEKGCYAHLGKQYSYSWNNNCVLACSLLTRKLENTIFSRAKEELQVAVGLLRGYVVYQISNNAHTCVCARMLTKEHICYTNSCVLIYRLCQIWCILSIQNKSVKIHDDHAMIIFVIFIYLKFIITCQINSFVTITITNTHTHTHTHTYTNFNTKIVTKLKIRKKWNKMRYLTK
jgi:hypothetical protein